MEFKLPAGYEIRELTDEEMHPIWQKHAPSIFDENSQIFRLRESLTPQELERVKTLRDRMGHPASLNLAIYFEGEAVGWCNGHQESAETFYMRNSAILPAHRRRGLYNALLQTTIEKVTELGFQKIYSRHSSTNNGVIIPKLKAGFTISSMEVSDMFGVLVHLVYFPKPLRRKVMNYRVGDLKPDDEIRKYLKI